MAKKTKGLGKGLHELLSATALSEEGKLNQDNDNTQRLINIALQHIQPGQYQPRSQIDPRQLDALVQSIKAQGIVQPVVLRRLGGEANRYELIAGERRWRAAQQAGLDEIPAVIHELSNQQALAVALIENIQREDLTPLEEATAIARLIEEFSLLQQEAADMVGKSRTAVANLLRLLSLTDEVKQLLAQGDLEMGHARALLALSEADQVAAAKQVISQGLTVRQTEQLVRKRLANDSAPAKPTVTLSTEQQQQIQHLQTELSARFARKVELRSKNQGAGKLIINYDSLADLQRFVAELLTEEPV